MKKFYLTMITVFFMSTVMFGQVFNPGPLTNGNLKYKTIGYKTQKHSSSKATTASVFSEDFESGAIPTGWEQSGGYDWSFGDNLSSTYWTIPPHTKYCGVNDDAQGQNGDGNDMWLKSPVIDLSSATSPTLKFEYHFTQYQSQGITTIKISTDGGTTWTDLETLTPNTEWEAHIIDLSSVVGEANFRFAFHYSDETTWNNGAVFDDVVINDVTAPDLVAKATGYVSEYYAQPMDQAIAFAPTGTVSNVGLELTDATNYELTITGGYSNSQAITVPMAAFVSSEDFTFDNFTPTEGDFTFDYNANYANDFDPSNNTASASIHFGGPELVRDNGDTIGNFNVGSEGGELGNIFIVSSKDTITSVKWRMAGTAGDQVAVIIRNVDTTGTPTTEVGRTVAVINDGSDNYEAIIIGQVVLDPGKYFIGCVEGAHYLNLKYTSTPFIEKTSWALSGGTWYDLGVASFPYTFYLRPQFNNFVEINNDVNLVSINTPVSTGVGNVDITGTVMNIANMSNLTSFDVTYTIDGGAAVATYNVTGIDIASGATYDFTHNVAWASTTGQHTIEVTISNPNGNVDENPTDNVLSKQILIVNEVFPKAVVYEEGTGTWCGFCVRGLVGLNTMAHDITDGTWVGIGVHNGENDPMTVTDYDAKLATFISGYPSGIMDRQEVVNPGLATLQAAYNLHKVMVPVAKIEISAQTWNTTSRDYTVQVTSTFALDMASADYNTALIIVEDSLHGTSSGWDQHNYYGGGSYGDMIDVDGYNYGDANSPSTRPAAEMYYSHVGRKLVDGWDGSANSIPSAVTYNTPYTFDYSGTLPAEANENLTKFVALVIDNATGAIVNATEVELNVETGVSYIKENSSINIFPNPSTGIVNVKGAENSTIEILNSLGAVVATINNASSMETVNLSGFNAGTYIVRVITDNNIIIKKVSLVK